MNAPKGLSFIVPAYNEENGIKETLLDLKAVLESLDLDYEIIVVDDSSKDQTHEVAKSVSGIKVVRHPINMGYGRALKTGILQSKYEWIGIIDADGTYPTEEVPRLVAEMERGFDMVVGARGNIAAHDSFLKNCARRTYKMLVNTLSGYQVDDPNSGLRIFTRTIALEFFEFLCERFSFTTSLSILAAMKPYYIKFIEVEYRERTGQSHVRHFKDSLTTLRIITEGVTYYNPLRFFILMGFMMIFLIGLPAMVLAMFSMHTLSAYYMLFGCTLSILIALGVVADVVRMANMKYRPISPDNNSNSKGC